MTSRDVQNLIEREMQQRNERQRERARSVAEPSAASSAANGRQSDVPRPKANRQSTERRSPIEHDTIGAILIHEHAWNAARAAGVTEADFQHPDLRQVYRAFSHLATGQVLPSVAEVAEHLERAGAPIDGGWLAFLSQLARETVLQTDQVIERIKALKRRAAMRLLGAGDVSEVRQLRQALAVLDAVDAPASPLPLELEPAAVWASRAEPAGRDWVIEGLVPGARVTSLLGDGGLGKTIIAGQIGVHVATGREFFGQTVKGGAVLGIFCEDERDELERRIRAAATGERLDLSALKLLYPCSRDGMDNLLCTFERDQIALTPFYHQLEATVAGLRPRLLILDPAADLFAGDYLSTPHVRQFLKVALGRFCVLYHCAVLLIAHPSAAGRDSGDGGGFSTAWNNSVRSRLYLRRPKSQDREAVKDRRILEVKKSNYAADGLSIPLVYERGYFVQDPEPLEESVKATRAPKVNTKLALATMQVMQEKGGGGTVVAFGVLFEELQRLGAILPGDYEIVRKPLQRTLEQLKSEGLIRATKIPRGYQLVTEAQ